MESGPPDSPITTVSPLEIISSREIVSRTASEKARLTGAPDKGRW